MADILARAGDIPAADLAALVAKKADRHVLQHLPVKRQPDLEELQAVVATEKELARRLLTRSPKEPEPGTLLTPGQTANELNSKAQELFHHTTVDFEINAQLRIDISEWIRQANLIIPELIENQLQFGWSKKLPGSSCSIGSFGVLWDRDMRP